MASYGCSTAVMSPFEDPIVRNSYGTFSRDQKRRRHSSHHTNHERPWGVDSENVQIMVGSCPCLSLTPPIPNR